MRRSAGIMLKRGRGILGTIPALGLILALALVLVVASSAPAAAADTGWCSPSANTNWGWANPEYGYTSNDIRAEATNLDDIVDYRTFSLGVPSGSTIQGIQVSVEGYREAIGWLDLWNISRQVEITLSWNNGSSYTSGAGLKTSSFGTSETTQTFGSSSDLWGRSWTAEEFSDANFRVRLDPISTYYAYWIRIDHVQVRVYYTLPTTSTTIATSGTPSTYGDNVTFTATVTRGAGTNTPSGTVTFMEGVTTLGTGTLSGTGDNATATYSTTLLAVGAHSNITAVYGGDSNFQGSTSTSITQTVNTRAITVTADAQGKTYGDADPALTYTYTPSLIGSDSFSGALSRAAGENVGTYAITQGTLTAGSNYTITYVGANLTISPLAITVTADAQGKSYGDADPALTYTYTPSLVGSDSFSGALSRAAGENVGTYAITQGTLALSGNYTITYVGANLTISPLAITVTADAQGKSYGDADPALTYTYTPSLIGSDSFSGSLARAAGENVGTYAITQGTLALSSNYTITYVGANLTISPLAITVTADAQGKTYGDADPALTYTYTPSLVGSDTFSGALSRAAGEDVGTYAINQGTLALSGNYALTYVGANLTISPLAITVTADAQGKSYGDADPALTYTYTPSLIGSDSFSGSLARAAGENVGTYAITQGTLALSSNYTITYVGANLTISPLAITVTADAQSKDYGDVDPALTYTYTPSLVGSDSFSGALSRAAVENVGTYAITQGTLTAGSNYTITYVGANLTISPLAITVTADAKGKTYGDVDPALTYTYTPSLVGSDSFSGALSRAAGENVGTYAITQGTLTAGSNYTITYVGANLTISPLAITVTADAQGKTYGDADPALTYTYTPSLIGSDSFSGALSRAAGENAGTYAMTQGTLALSSNYTITYVGANLTISPLAITVTADAQGKSYGDVDPALTYTYTPSLIGSDSFSGALSRAAGENVGTYAITQGTLALSGNYSITYVGANLTITPPVLTITTASPLPNATVGSAYSQTLTATGGTTPYTWSIDSGTLPDGLTLNASTGEISGTPTTAGGPVSITFKVTDSVAGTATSALSITVDKGTPTITWPNPADIVYGTALSGTQLNATASVPGAFVYTPASGTLLNAGSGQTMHVDFTPTDTANYNSVSADVTINVTPLEITVTADSGQTKDYGDADPALTYTYTPSLIGSDSFSGALSRAAGENAGTYAITQGTLALSSNYTITYVGANLTISPLAITVTADAQGKSYGDVDPALTYTYTPSLIGSDSFSGSLARAAGENAGTYAITQGTLTAGSNYTITYVGANLTISPLAITVTADAQGKDYGDADPALTYTHTPSLIGSDTFSGALSRAAGENVGTYAINQGALALSGNYTITYVGANLTISPLAITVTADAQGKTYGDVDPALTYTYTPSLIGSDSFSGALSRAAGEDVGTYAINQGTLALSSNYTITYVGANLTINAAPLTITSTSPLPGATVGAAYSQTLTAIGGTLPYSWSIDSGSLPDGLSLAADGVISGTPTTAGGPASITFRVTDGAAESATVVMSITVDKGTTTVTWDNPGDIAYGTALSGTQLNAAASVPGAFVYTPASGTLLNAGSGQTLHVDFTPTDPANFNSASADVTINVTPLAITVTADAGIKIYGDPDPALTYTHTPSLVGSDTFSGALSRAAGENVGTYGIAQGTLTAGANYSITYVGASLTVSPRALTITADDLSKTFGDTLTFAGTEFAATGLVNSDTVDSITLTSAGADASAAIGDYDIFASAAVGAGLSNYTITYANGTLTVGLRALTVTADNRSKIYGDTAAFSGAEFTVTGLVNSDTVTGVTLISAGAGAAAAAGTYDIVPAGATGSGLENYAITYSSGTLTVGKAGVSWTVTSSPASSAQGSPVTFTATVNNTDATGTVTFRDGGTVLGTGTLSKGVATYTASDLSIGSHYITVSYDGDVNFADGASLAHIHTVKAQSRFNWWWIVITAAAAGGFFFFFLILYRRRKRKEQEEAA